MDDREGPSRQQPRRRLSRRPTDVVDWIVVGLVVVWALVVFGFGLAGYAAVYSWERIWDVFFMGTGWAILLSVPIRLLLPAYRRNLADLAAISGMCLGIAYQHTQLWLSIVAWLGVGAIMAVKLWRGLSRFSDED